MKNYRPLMRLQERSSDTLRETEEAADEHPVRRKRPLLREALPVSRIAAFRTREPGQKTGILPALLVDLDEIFSLRNSQIEMDAGVQLNPSVGDLVRGVLMTTPLPDASLQWRPEGYAEQPASGLSQDEVRSVQRRLMEMRVDLVLVSLADVLRLHPISLNDLLAALQFAGYVLALTAAYPNGVLLKPRVIASNIGIFISTAKHLRYLFLRKIRLLELDPGSFEEVARVETEQTAGALIGFANHEVLDQLRSRASDVDFCLAECMLPKSLAEIAHDRFIGFRL